MQANQAVFFALLEPGDTVLSLSLRDGGHLSHGDPDNVSGRCFRTVHYGVRESDGLIDYDEMDAICRRERPRLIIVGGSSYPRAIDFTRCHELAPLRWRIPTSRYCSRLRTRGSRRISESFPHVDVVTTSTNKNLRGPRGGLILCDDDEIASKLHRGVFPGVQGGPLPEYIAAKAVCFREALAPEFGDWGGAVLENARALAAALQRRGYRVATGGTDTPLVLIDLRPTGITGARAQSTLEAAGLPCNKNLIPGDSQPFEVTSGIRFGVLRAIVRVRCTQENADDPPRTCQPGGREVGYTDESAAMSPSRVGATTAALGVPITPASFGGGVLGLALARAQAWERLSC